MILVVGLGWALLAGADLRRVALLALTLALPWTLLGLLTLAFFRGSREQPRPVLFCESVASELRSGATLGQALGAAATAVGSPSLDALYRSGATVRERCLAASEEFEEIGRELVLTVDAAARSGDPSADLFDELGSIALAQIEIAREVRVASAPARATVMVFAIAPTLYLAHRLTSGGLATLLATSAQRSVTLVGIGLFLAGLLAVLSLVVRAR
jgi:Flp pilus assembly protein TadB